MSTKPPHDDNTALAEHTLSACAPPRRNALASRLDRSHAFSLLFDEPTEPVQIGRFTLLSSVGSGGMGEVYAARDKELGRKVAIKLVRSDRSASHQAQERLLREAQTLARLSHPNVVQVYEAGRFEGQVFIAMELIRGQTLRMWLEAHATRGDRASQREVLRQFVAAGRGLQAAHAAGLVHRDFKPDNVLVGDDGRPRVVDFGLARPVTTTGMGIAVDGPENTLAALAHSETLPADVPAPPPNKQSLRAARVLSSRGHIAGTPRYMSPEQIRGEDADHRSDQFSFCVALYEALHGHLPFTGVTLEELRRAMENGALREPPRGSKVPAPVQRALVRGLSLAPVDRFPDMQALLHALCEWPAQRQRRRLMGISLAVLLAGGSLAYGLARPEPPCDSAGITVAELWTPARRTAIRDAFARTGLDYAETSWDTLEQHLDGYATRLQNELTTTCAAIRAPGGQSSDLLYLRTLCLSGRQQRLDALLTELEQADTMVVERAHTAASELPDLNVCRHIDTLRYGMKPPERAVAGEVNEIRIQLAEAHTHELLGRSAEALRIARAQLARAEALDYDPVHAEALFQTGRVLVYHGTDPERAEGEALLQRAVNLAESERHDELVAASLNHMVLGAVRNHPRTRQARTWQERANAAIKRIGDPPRLRADALRNLGRIEYREAHFDKAEEHQRRALALLDSDPDVPPLMRGLYLHDLASTQRELGRYQEATETFKRALALHVAVLGQLHPYVTDLRVDIAMLHAARGELETADQLLGEVMRVHTVALDKNHPVLGRAHLELAEVQRQRGALNLAHTHARAGLEIYTAAYGATHGKLADAHARLGAIAYRRGLHEEALAAYEAAFHLMVLYRGKIHIDTGLMQANLAEALVALGRHDEALGLVQQAEHTLKPHLAAYPEITPFLASVRGRALLGKGEADAAAQVLEGSARGFAALPSQYMAMERADAYWALVQALSTRAQPEDPRLQHLARQALDVYEQQGPEVDSPATAVQRWLAVDRRHR